MKIGIDLGPAAPGLVGGLAVLVRELVQHLGQLFPEHEYLLYGTVHHAQGWPERMRFIGLPEGEEYGLALDQCVAGDGVGVLFRQYPLHSQSLPPERQVILIPDLLHEDHPEFFAPEVVRARRISFNQAMTRAGALVTISEFSRQRLLGQGYLHGREVVLVYPGITPHRGPLTLGGERGEMPEEAYFYYPANLWPHKNHRRLLQAFKQFLGETGAKCSLVFTGHPEGWEELRREFPGVPVRHLGYVSKENVQQLLAGARALVFFSLYEGFGMPVLEALAAGTPVLCSNTTSLPEVAGNAALGCDPRDVAAMAELMGRIGRESGLAEELRLRGLERAKQFSWEQSARTLEETLRRVAEKSRVPAEVRIEDKPLVSIVTPSYNQGRFLRRTIDSVLEQDYPHIEYHVMDGGSQDESVEILRSYGSRLTWVSEPDGGQTAAINKGIARSRGTIRAYLNSDDVLLPGAVSQVVEHFATHPDWDLVYGKAHIIDDEDRLLGDYPTAKFSFPRLLEDCCICQPAAFWRKRLAERVGPFDERLHYAMDYDYWMRGDRAGGLLQHVPEFLASSRWYAQTKTLSARVQVYQEIFQVSLRHAGYVGPGHYFGYWHHLARERPTGWPRRLRNVPGFVGLMARLHSRWHRSGSQVLPFCRDSVLGLGGKVLRKVKGLKNASR